MPPRWGYDCVVVYYLSIRPDQTFDGTLLPQSRAALRVTLSRDLPRAILGAWFSSRWTQDFSALRPRMIKPPFQAPFALLLYSLAPARLALRVHLRWLQLDLPKVSFQRLGSAFRFQVSSFSPPPLHRALLFDPRFCNGTLTTGLECSPRW